MYSLDNFLANDKLISILKTFNKNSDIPNIIITGDYGSGKTYLRKSLINHMNINTDDIMYINMDNDFKKFNQKTNKFINHVKKPMKNYIIIDNVEDIDIKKQYILKSVLDNINKNTTFFFFINDISKLIQQLSSHFLIFRLNTPSKKDYLTHLQNVMTTQSITINDSILKYIIDISDNFRELNNNMTIILSHAEHNNLTKIQKKDIKGVVNVSDKIFANKIIKLCVKRDIHKVIDIVDKMLKCGYSIIDILNILTKHIKDININILQKTTYIEIISFGHIKMNEGLTTYAQLCSLLAKMCKC